jgi:hypothetical protein
VRNSSWIYIFRFVLLVSLTPVAQQFPRVELAGGYSYVNFHPNIPGISNQNLNGGPAHLSITLPTGLASRLTSWITPLKAGGQVGCPSVAICSPNSSARS